MRDCSTHAFDGCSCTNTCQSATLPIIKILDRPPVFTPTFRDFIAVFAFITSMAVIIGGTIHLNEHYGKQDRIEQETNAWRR